MTIQSASRLILLLALSSAPVFSVYEQGGNAKLPPKPTPRPTATPKPSKTPPGTGIKPEAPPEEPKKNEPPSPDSFSRNPEKIEEITFNQVIEGELNWKTSGRLSAIGFYNDYSLTASSADLFTIQLQTANPTLTVQILDYNRNGLPIKKNPLTGQFQLDTPGNTLPRDDEYYVRVVGVLTDAKDSPIPYTLTVIRTGLTEEGYRARIEQILSNFNFADPQNVNDTIAKLEQLTREDPKRPAAYENLGTIYLYYRNDLDKAVSAMGQVIKLGFSVSFRLSSDKQWRRPDKVRPKVVWKEPRERWLKIRPDLLEFSEAGATQHTLFSLNSQQIKEVERSRSSPVISLKSTILRETVFFAPATNLAIEADLIVNMIKRHVLRK